MELSVAKVILLLVFLSVAGGIAFLAFSEVPAPTQTVQKQIATDKFFQR